MENKLEGRFSSNDPISSNMIWNEIRNEIYVYMYAKDEKNECGYNQIWYFGN